MRLFRATCCAAALTALLAPGVRADDYNKLTYITFSGSVQIPGAMLEAGTYAFKLADPESGRRAIQIWNRDQTHMYTTLLTISNQRMDTPDKPIVMFKEAPAGESQAVQAWFYPGDRYGMEFVYPKDQAVKIAKASHEKVLAYADNSKWSTKNEFQSAKIGRVSDSGQFDNEESRTAQAQPAPAAQAPAATTSAPRSSTTTAPRMAQATTTAPVGTSGQARPNELPRTASELPLLELLSFLSLAGAMGARGWRMKLTDR